MRVPSRPFLSNQRLKQFAGRRVKPAPVSRQGFALQILAEQFFTRFIDELLLAQNTHKRKSGFR
jgi:hypothetical protein